MVRRLPRLPAATTADEKSSRPLGNYRNFFTPRLASLAVAFRMTFFCAATYYGTLGTLIGMEGANQALPQTVTETNWKMAHRVSYHLEAMA